MLVTGFPLPLSLTLLFETNSPPGHSCVHIARLVRRYFVQPADIGWPTGDGKKLSSSQAQLGQATCLADAYFLSISCVTSYVATLYLTWLNENDPYVIL